MTKQDELVRQIDDIKKNKLITVFTNKKNEQLEFLQSEEGERHILKRKDKLVRLIQEGLEGNGAIVIHVDTGLKKEIDVKGKKLWVSVFKVAGIRLENGIIYYLSDEEVEVAHTHDNEGNFIGSEPNLKYVSFEEL